MADDRLREAVQTVAKHVIWSGLDSVIGEMWENYPEIGEHDWQRVEEQVQKWAPRPDAEAFKAAYEFLEGRAEK